MIELILATLNNILARLLDAVISWWGKELMPLSMAEMTKKIPFLATGYSVFQSMALAFAIIIAAFSIYSVFLSAGESRTSPVRVLVMTGVSIGMIYFGNYIAMMLVDFIKNPYEAFWGLELEGAQIEWDKVLDTGIFPEVIGLIKTAAIFILTVAITVALFKLYVEISCLSSACGLRRKVSCIPFASPRLRQPQAVLSFWLRWCCRDVSPHLRALPPLARANGENHATGVHPSTKDRRLKKDMIRLHLMALVSRGQ